jgi:DnaK suppressor protein
MIDNNYKLIRLRLEKEHKGLHERLDQSRADQLSEERSEGSPFGKCEEEAAATTDRENLVAQEQRIIDQLADIEAALNKFVLGTFGTCENAVARWN